MRGKSVTKQQSGDWHPSEDEGKVTVRVILTA